LNTITQQYDDEQKRKNAEFTQKRTEITRFTNAQNYTLLVVILVHLDMHMIKPQTGININTLEDKVNTHRNKSF